MKFKTREEKLEWIKNNTISRKDRKKKKSERAIELYKLKQTHDWNTIFIKHNVTGTSGKLQATNCKNCGVDWGVFKLNPFECPKQG